MINRPLFLFKYGGNAMTDAEVKKTVLTHVVALKKKGYHVVIAHGGGPFIKQTLDAVHIQSEFIDGQRYTTPEAFKYIEMTLKGEVNSDLVTTINTLGCLAVGLSGRDGKMVIASQRKHKRMEQGQEVAVDLGQVGEVTQVNPDLLFTLLKNDFIPVIACIGAGEDGTGFNINGDTFAGYLAGALQVDQYVVLTDVDGLLQDKDNPASIIRKLSLDEVHKLRTAGVIQGGMIPKMEACETAIKMGAKSAKIINGTQPEQILEIEKETIGTLIVK